VTVRGYWPNSATRIRPYRGIVSRKFRRLVRVSELEPGVTRIDGNTQGFEYPSEYGKTAFPVRFGCGADISEPFPAEPAGISELAEPGANLRLGKTFRVFFSSLEPVIHSSPYEGDDPVGAGLLRRLPATRPAAQAAVARSAAGATRATEARSTPSRSRKVSDRGMPRHRPTPSECPRHLNSRIQSRGRNSTSSEALPRAPHLWQRSCRSSDMSRV
jgi:hypothetical protein